jgi:acetyl esterase/lipase
VRHAFVLACVGVVLFGFTSAPRAQTSLPAGIPLWPEGVPGAIKDGGPEVMADGRVSNVHTPSLIPFPAAQAARNGTAVIVCPGGGYNRLAIEKEGVATARWLNSLGVSAYILKYRLKEYGHPAPLRDVLRAVRMLRSDAVRLGISADRIGVLGFSAGGHLAASAGTLYDDRDGRTGAPLDAVSARPDFLVLVYPVIRLIGPHTHSGSGKSLLGADATPEMLDRYSPDTRVTKDTPPAFLVHGGTDTAVPPENSVAFYLALRRAGVPAELHLYREGAHGIGLEPNHGPMSDWPARCAEWMAAKGLISIGDRDSESTADRARLLPSRTPQAGNPPRLGVGFRPSPRACAIRARSTATRGAREPSARSSGSGHRARPAPYGSSAAEPDPPRGDPESRSLVYRTGLGTGSSGFGRYPHAAASGLLT